eukprot:g20337.t1
MSCTLCFSFGAAASSAIISAWLLFLMLPFYLFAIIFLMTLMTSFLGLYLPYRCTRPREWLVMPTTNLAWATLLSVNGSIMAIEYALDQAVYTLIGAVDHFVRLAVAMTGLAMGFSMQIFLVHYIHAQEGASLRRWRRVVWTKMAGVPNAQLVECNDLAAACPGDCAICLEPLVALPELQLSVEVGVPREVGLLKLPCEHTYHASCADGWMMREVTCPLCRAPIGSLKRCQRICLRRGGRAEGGETPSTVGAVSIEIADAARVDGEEAPVLHERPPQVLGHPADEVASDGWPEVSV